MTVTFRSRAWNVSNRAAEAPTGLHCYAPKDSLDRRLARSRRLDYARRSRKRCLAARACWKRWRKRAPKIDDARAAVRFWDASAIIPLLADEPTRERLLGLLEEDPQVLAWWGTPVEIASALARRECEKLLTADEVTAALVAVRQFADNWHEIVPSDSVRRTAERLLRAHPLRAADSLQLAAALVAADHNPSSLEMVCLDARLSSAARREGFTVVQN